MIENVLRAIGGVAVYDAISICLFVTVFCVVLFRAARMKRPFLNAMSSLPLNDDKPLSNDDTHE